MQRRDARKALLAERIRDCCAWIDCGFDSDEVTEQLESALRAFYREFPGERV